MDIGNDENGGVAAGLAMGQIDEPAVIDAAVDVVGIPVLFDPLRGRDNGLDLLL